MQPTSVGVGDVYAKLRHPLVAYLRRHVRNSAVAEDLVQQVFVKALGTLKAGQPIGNMPGWLYQVARTTAIDYHRSRREQSAIVVEDAASGAEDDDRLHQQLASCLRPPVDSLPALYRDTLLATDFEGQTLRSVATKSDVSLSAIKSRVTRARKLLKAKLLECCIVEVTNGAVSDYRRRGSQCGSRC
jgi:RNA polymerase sigma-70 factor, ECF subfamily